MNKYGWIPQFPDLRDRPFIPKLSRTFLEEVDLRADQPPIYDQGNIGSCVGNAVARCLQYAQKMQGQDDFTPSRLQLYYEGREMLGTIPVDSGCMIRDVVKFAAKEGAGPESLWPYETAKFKMHPPDAVYAEGTEHQAISYHAVPQDAAAIHAALSEQCVVVLGIVLYESFETDEVRKTGMVPMPKPGERPIGGHAIANVGRLPSRQPLYPCANSWGPDWGDHGYFYLPENYILHPKLASDFWCVRLVEA